MVLKFRATRRTSGGPCPAGDRVSRVPPPSRCAASSSALRGRLTQRASAAAATVAAASPATATKPSHIHSVRRRWSSPAVERDSTTAPTIPSPSSLRTGTTIRNRSPTRAVSVTVPSRAPSTRARAAAPTVIPAPPFPATRWPPGP